MRLLALTEVDLARLQFAMTSLYHFIFVPLTLGLAPLVAVMQTRWHRTGDEAWLRLTRFFGTLLLINFAIGVATGDYIPSVATAYWSMRVMAYVGTLMFLIAAAGAWLYRKRKLDTARWYLRIAVVAMAFPFIAASAGWVLTEMGRQPWIVQGLLRTSDAHSPSVSSTMIIASLAVLAALYVVLAIVDFVLMRRFAVLDPPEVGSEPAVPVVTT